MSTASRLGSLLRLGLTAAAAAVGWVLVTWILTPAALCIVPGDVDPSYTCPNRFGFSLPRTVILGLALVGAAALANVAWHALAEWARPDGDDPPIA